MNKVALVIGNGAYKDAPLKNPSNDALDMNESLTELGFRVFKHVDATAKEMDEALRKFTEELSKNEVGLVFFAGHGMQIEGENYLTAVDTDFSSEIDAKFSSLPLNKVIECMDKSANKTDIIMLDACRDNPYDRNWRSASSRTLAPVYAPRGMIICYATSPGQVASDGLGPNGPYTSAFLRHVKTPNLPIEDLFKRVRKTLSSTTKDKQISWEHTSLMGDFYFSHSLLSDELIPSYSEEALKDSKFKASSPTAKSLIRDLKSHNWYTQNPVAQKLKNGDLARFTIDELFVLGRNIYQAACGNATELIQVVKCLESSLGTLDQKVSYHILNGMLYEIYFDSKGRFRDRKKSEYYNEVLDLDGNPDHEQSMLFIRRILSPYSKELFYLPSTAQKASVDICFVLHNSGKYTIESICFGGENVMYETDGKTYYTVPEDFDLSGEEVDAVDSEISRAMIYPTRLLTVNHVNLPSSVNKILKPWTFNLKMT